MSIFFTCCCYFFFFNDTATTEIYTLSLHDALPISDRPERPGPAWPARRPRGFPQPRLRRPGSRLDRKSTRLNSSHVRISYAVFCLKKKNGADNDFGGSEHCVLRLHLP